MSMWSTSWIYKLHMTNVNLFGILLPAKVLAKRVYFEHISFHFSD